MADSTSLIPCLPNLVPHTVTQDASFVGTNSDPIPFPPDVTFVTEQTDSPKLINLVKRSAYVNHNNVHLHLVEFPLQMVAKMHQLLTQIAKYDCT